MYEINMQKVIIRKTKMQTSYLLVLLTIISLSYGQIPLVALQINYCQVSNLSTPELALSINPQSSRNRSEDTIVRTQFYEIEGNTVSLAYISNSGNLLIQETGDNLISSIYTEDIIDQLVFIDSRDQYIIAIEITDGVNAQFNYVLLKADLRNSFTFIKHRISSTDSISSSIADLRLTKIVQIQGDLMYVLMQGKQRTSVFTIDLTSEEDMTLFADLSNTTSLDIVSGNINHLYDASTMRFYELSGEVGSETYTPTQLSELNIDSIIDLQTLKFTQLNNLVLLLSTLNNETIIIPIDKSPISPARAIKIEATSPAAIYTDNFKNFIAVTSKDFVWVRSTDLGMVYNDFSSTLPIAQRDELQIVFSRAKYISFDKNYAMVISKNIGNNLASLTSVLYDPEKTPYFTTLDKHNNALDLDSNDITQLITPNASQKFITSIKCNCISLQVERIQCFAGALKCITLTKTKRVDCTKQTQISTLN